MKPTVTVLMSVYNGARYLESAVSSILQQTFTDFEFVIINDGSRDDSRNILERFQDSRIRLIHTENRGLAAALARGVEEARGSCIARMDADDLAPPDRLATQVGYLKEHPGIGVVDSDYVHIDANDVELRVAADRTLGESFMIAWKLLWENPICHPAVMLRRESLTDCAINYDPDSVVEDYDLWTRLLFHTRFGHIPTVLLRYRVHPAGMTGSRDSRQLDATSRIQQRTLSTLVGRPLDPMVGHSVALLSRQTAVTPGPDALLDTNHLVGIVDDVRSAFATRFGLSRAQQSRVDGDLARRFLDWALVLSRVPGRSGDRSGLLMRRALSLNPSVVLEKRFSRNLLARAFG
jgi:hypothetical protein